MQEGRSQFHHESAPAGAGLSPVPVEIAALRLRTADGGWLALDGTRTHIMGVLNLTPDSFSDGGRFLDPAAALTRARDLVAAGATILDLGAESTRPGAAPVSPTEEWRRLEPVLRGLAQARLPAVLSLDTRHGEVAGAAAELGVSLLNLPFPQELVSQRAVLSRFHGVVLMHARGTPQTMTGLLEYGADTCATVAAELQETAAALFGDQADRAPILYDPGLGFAKSAAHSLSLLGQVRRLGALLGRPILIGASRKSFLGHATGLPVSERLVPSVVAALMAAQQGAAVVRVHDVAETRAALTLWQAAAQAAADAPEGRAW